MTAVVSAAALLLLSATTWTVVLGVGGHELPPVAVVLVAVSMWVAVVTSSAGMLVSRSRWARRLGLAVTAGQALLAVTAEIGPWWWAGTAVSAAAAVALGGPWLNVYVRGLPAASGPPTRAILVPLLLVATPFALGITTAGSAAAAVVGGTALVIAFWFVRALPLALTAVRALWPLVAAAGGWIMGWPSGAVAAGMGVVVAAVAWDTSVTRAVVPLVEQGSIVPIPPELAPRDVLDAAAIDERGRPR